MLTRSAKSLVTVTSLSEVDVDVNSAQSKEGQLPPTNVFEDLLPIVLKKYNCTFETYVKKAFLTDPLENKKLTSASFKSKKDPDSMSNKDETERSRPESTSASTDFIIITALYDKHDNLVEVAINKQGSVPRMLFQVMSIVAPLYDMLTKITIKECRIDSNTIYELKNNIDAMLLTEVCLDGSYVTGANFAVLLETQSSLTYLSLCRCGINDEVCKNIVSKMHYQAAAEKQLLTLHLSGNLITDEGVEAISEMLRSNRHLRYLNLAGNRLSDEGASLIFKVLTEFRLTLNENNNRRLRIMHYMKRKNKLVSKLLTECVLESVSTNEKDGGKQQSETKKEKKPKNIRVHVALTRAESSPELSDADRLRRAHAAAAVLVGQQDDPFGVGKVVLRDGWAHCKGNFTICYLNLAYNELTHLSIRKVLYLLLYQQDIVRQQPKESGLMKIVLEGNLVPEMCPEYAQITDIINDNLILDKYTVKIRQSIRSTSRK